MANLLGSAPVSWGTGVCGSGCTPTPLDPFASENEYPACGEDLLTIIGNEDVSTLMQPILDVRAMSIIGYEALSRGPAGSVFQNAETLFQSARAFGLSQALDRVCLKKALRAAADIPGDRLLFLNIEPEGLADPGVQDDLVTLSSSALLQPNRVVLELTERGMIVDFDEFRADLANLRELGFRVAIDDAGAGHSCLQSLVEVRPDWVTLDMSLIRGVDTNEVKRDLVASLIGFGERTGMKLITEGIETMSQLTTLQSLGARYGQGFLLSRPRPPFPDDRECLVGQSVC